MKTQASVLAALLCLPVSSLAQAPANAGAHVSSQTSRQSVPAALRPVLYQTLSRNAGPTYAIGNNGCAALPKQHLQACFSSAGVHFIGADKLTLQLAAWGRGDNLHRVSATAPTIAANRASYVHGNLTEWWRVLPVGFEQSFTVTKRPKGNGELTLALTASGKAKIEDGTLAFGKLRYGQLVVTDANGKLVPSSLTAKSGRILIAVNDARAAYPLSVDPLVWLEQKVTASDGAAYDGFGFSAAVSGATALVGADQADNQGAAYVFIESGGIWTQSAKLTADDGAAGDDFGHSVALDGTTALVGAFNATVGGNAAQGAAYVFTESGGTWSQTAKLTADDGASNDLFGWSVALAGTMALAGVPNATVNGHSGAGAAYIFDDSGGTWTQSTKLTAQAGATNDAFGFSVALDSTTALVGAYAVNSEEGAAYTFHYTGTTWSRTGELTAADGAAGDNFGYSVALSGTTALVGAYHATIGGNAGQGAAYLFTESGVTWTQSAKLTAADGAAGDAFGLSVALDGTGAFVGAPGATVGGNTFQGAAYLFDDSGGTWTQTQKLIASDGAADDEFGSAVALSGTSALVGVPAAVIANVPEGAAYFYDQGDLALAVSAPAAVDPGEQYVSQTLATNNASAASPAVTATVAVPAAASFVSATASQGTCSEDTGKVTCNFGAIAGNAGMATANVTLKAMGSHDATIENTASVNNATPVIRAAAPTVIDTAPVAQDGTLVTLENTAASGTLIATDADGDPLTYAIDTQPANGTLTLDNASTGAYTYTPDNGYTGGDSFTFHAYDGTRDSNVATVSITVNAVGGGGACPIGYAEYDGMLAANRRSAVLSDYHAPAGAEKGILIAPAGFQIYAAFRQDGGAYWRLYVTPGPLILKHASAGRFKWAVKAGAGGGAYTLCLQHP